MKNTLSRYLGFYLPQRFRRWFIYLPIDAALLLALLLSTALIRASFISVDHLYPAQGVPAEVDLHLKWLEGIVQRSSAESRLDIYSGYREFCGRSIEWDPGFYMFYAMSMDELASVAPERRAYAAKQVDLCTRLMLGIPADANNVKISRRLQSRNSRTASIITGYECLVLGIRKALLNDTLYDVTLRNMSDALTELLSGQLKQCHMIWTSDQATQLYAIWRADQVLGTDHSALFVRWMETMQAKFIERDTGLLISRVSIHPDRFDSPPRGTSIAWTIILLADIYPEFAAQQYAAFQKHRNRQFASMSAVAEFPDSSLFAFGDLDSGPMVLGISPSATGFGLGVHRLFGTQSDFARCYRIFELFGQPRTEESGKYYRISNGMGDAILLYSKIARARKG